VTEKNEVQETNQTKRIIYKKSKSFPFHALKAYRVELWFHSDAGEWLTPRPSRFTPGKEPRFPWNRMLGGT